MAGGLAAATVLFSVLGVALLTRALLNPSSALAPAGLTTIGLVWGLVFALTSLVALIRGSSRQALLATLVAFLASVGFLEAWTRAAALAPQGSIAPGELWPYVGGRLYFLGAGVLVVAAAVIRWPRA